MGDEREDNSYDSFRPELDPNEFIRDIYYTLTGKYYDEKEKRVKKSKKIIQKFSDDNINAIMKTLKFYINPISQSTKLKDLDIRMMVFEIYCKIVTVLANEKKVNFDIIFKTAEEVKSLIFMAQMSSVGGFKYGRYTGTVKRDESVQITEDRTNKGSGWGKPKRPGGN